MVLGLLGAIAAAFLIPAIVAGSKKVGDTAGAASSKGNFWQSIKEGFKKLFFQGHGPQGQIIDDSDTGSLEDAWSLKDMPDNPYEGTSRIEMPNSGVGTPVMTTPLQSSAQSNVSTPIGDNVSDVANSATYLNDSASGSGAMSLSQFANMVPGLFSTMGLSHLLSPNFGDYTWKDYDDIVDNERLYGEGMIADARRWQEYMSSTAYQRTVKDIEAAGLNPWLAVQSGSLSPSSWGAVDTGSTLGNISTSLSQSISNSNSTTGLIAAILMFIMKMAS